MAFEMANILISDDSASMREMVEFTLVAENHQVMQADDGKQALILAKEYQFDLIITDVNMPNIDGLELVRALRNLPNYQFKPILVLTTETDSEKKQIAKTAGATGWIVKPFNPDKLLAAIRKVLE